MERRLTGHENCGADMRKIHYLAYGSNLHPLRLQERVPSAESIGVVEVRTRKLSFSKKSKDLSGKCNFHATENVDDVVYGVLYEINPNDKEHLDRAEGKGKGYNEALIKLELDGVLYAPFTYVADSKYIDFSLLPYEWYKGLVVEGAKFHSMPDKYIEWIESFIAIPDSDPKRNAENQARLERIKTYNKSKSTTSD